jgi:alpha-ribazole phosphatase
MRKTKKKRQVPMEGQKQNDNVTQNKRTTCTEVWLVRHGETDWNIEGRIQGQLNVPLNDVGKQQAQDLGRFLASYKPQEKDQFCGVIYSSDLDRALETAKILFSTCTDYNLTGIEKDERLRELNFGEMQGFKWTEKKETNGDHGTARPELPVVHGAESYQELQNRIEAVIEDIVWKNIGKRIIITTHGGAIRSYLCSVLGLTLRNMGRLVISNTSITRIKLYSCNIVAENSKKLKLLKKEVVCMNWMPHG